MEVKNGEWETRGGGEGQGRSRVWMCGSEEWGMGDERGEGRTDSGYECVEVKNGEWETRGGRGKGRADPGYGCVEVKNGEWEEGVVNYTTLEVLNSFLL